VFITACVKGRSGRNAAVEILGGQTRSAHAGGFFRLFRKMPTDPKLPDRISLFFRTKLAAPLEFPVSRALSTLGILYVCPAGYNSGLGARQHRDKAKKPADIALQRLEGTVTSNFNARGATRISFEQATTTSLVRDKDCSPPTRGLKRDASRLGRLSTGSTQVECGRSVTLVS
jgi:hypothetical protein